MSEDELMAKMDETLMSELDAVEKSYKTDLTVTLNQEDGQWVAEESNVFKRSHRRHPTLHQA
ncbi:MAG: hypothetical protein ACLTK0_11825 [Anaerovoracaceae bacterium]